MRGRIYIYIFFNSTAEKLAIYSDFRYISQIFPTLFPKLIRIDIILLHTFSMGAKTRARLTQERTVRLRYAQLSSSVRGKLIEKIMNAVTRRHPSRAAEGVAWIGGSEGVALNRRIGALSMRRAEWNNV